MNITFPENIECPQCGRQTEMVISPSREIEGQKIRVCGPCNLIIRGHDNSEDTK